MTYEEMLALGEKIAGDLRKAGYDNPEVLKEDAKPGDPIGIAFGHVGGDFVLELNTL